MSCRTESRLTRKSCHDASAEPPPLLLLPGHSAHMDSTPGVSLLLLWFSMPGPSVHGSHVSTVPPDAPCPKLTPQHASPSQPGTCFRKSSLWADPCVPTNPGPTLSLHFHSVSLLIIIIFGPRSLTRLLFLASLYSPRCTVHPQQLIQRRLNE